MLHNYMLALVNTYTSNVAIMFVTLILIHQLNASCLFQSNIRVSSLTLISSIIGDNKNSRNSFVPQRRL